MKGRSLRSLSSRLGRCARRALLPVLACALAPAALPVAAVANDLGAPGRPMLVEPDHVVVEGQLRAHELESGDTRLALLSPSGRLYRLAGAERAGLLEAHAGMHITVTGIVRPVAEGPDELVVESARLGGR